VLLVEEGVELDGEEPTEPLDVLMEMAESPEEMTSVRLGFFIQSMASLITSTHSFTSESCAALNRYSCEAYVLMQK